MQFPFDRTVRITGKIMKYMKFANVIYYNLKIWNKESLKSMNQLEKIVVVSV